MEKKIKNKIKNKINEIENIKFTLKGVSFKLVDVATVGSDGRLEYVKLKRGEFFTAYNSGSGIKIATNSRLGRNFKPGVLAKHGKDGISSSMGNKNSDVDIIKSISEGFSTINSLYADIRHIDEYGVESFLTSGLRYADPCSKEFYCEFLEQPQKMEEGEKETAEYADYSHLGYGLEFRRNDGFYPISRDNGLIGTFWFRTEEERDLELKKNNELYSLFTKERVISSEDSETLWNRIFYGGIKYEWT